MNAQTKLKLSAVPKTRETVTSPDEPNRSATPAQPQRTVAQPEPLDDEDDNNWADSPNIVIRQQPVTKVHINPYGQLVIKQMAWPEDDPFVFFNMENVPDLISALQDFLDGRRS